MVKRRAVKVFIQRIRRALEHAFRQAGVTLDPGKIVRSLASDTNVVNYCVNARIDFVHVR
jgi:hypothetical protein